MPINVVRYEQQSEYFIFFIVMIQLFNIQFVNDIH